MWAHRARLRSRTRVRYRVAARKMTMREQVRGWCERHGLFLCAALACLTRFPALSTPPLSVDETWTWYVTAEIRRTGLFWRTTALGVDAPLFVAINALVARLAGLSVLGLRAPQALFGTLSVLLFFRFMKRRYPAPVALPAALLAAWSPFLVLFSGRAPLRAAALLHDGLRVRLRRD